MDCSVEITNTNSVIAIDPGFSKSGTGIAYFEEGKLIKVGYVAPDPKLSFKQRMEKIIDCILDEFEWVSAKFVVETSFYQGKANISHNKLLGALDYMFDIYTIAALSVKKFATSSGKA